MTKKETILSVRINQKLKKKLTEKAESEGMKFSEAVRYALRKWTES